MAEERPRQSGPAGSPAPDPVPEGEEAAPPGVRTAAIVRWGLVAAVAVLAAGTWTRIACVPPPRAAAVAGYQCPMHPSVTAEHAGPCPICGMDLVPIDRSAKAARPSEVHGLAAIELSPERIQLIGMRTAAVARERLSPELRTVGFVTADEGGIAVVSARYSGWIERVLVPQSGAPVRRGQKLAAIYSPELIAAQQAYLNSVRWEKETAPGSGASSMERDARVRLQLAGMLDEDIDELARRRQVMRVLYLRSPIDGHVGRRTAVAGLAVQPGAELFEIADLSSMWVLADVYESEVDRVQVGQPARVALPGGRAAVEGRITFVYPAVSTGSRTVQVRVSVPNEKLALRPGMFLDVVLSVPPVEGLFVPLEAVVDTGELQYAFVSAAGGRLEPRRLRLGARGQGQVQVLEGLAEGERVVTTANFLVDSESRLRAAIEGLGGPPAPPVPGGERQHADEHEGREAPAHEAGEHGPGAVSGEAPLPPPVPGSRRAGGT